MISSTSSASTGPNPTAGSAAAPDGPPSGSKLSPLRAAGQALSGYLTNRQRLTRIAIAAAVSLPLTFLLVYYTKGALLYRIDWVGVYSVQGFLRTPIPDAILPTIGSALSFGNLTAANYIALFLDAFFCAYGAQLLARELFRDTFSDRWLLPVQAIAAAAYLVNPYSVTWSVYSLQLELFLSQAAFFVFMMEIIRLLRCGRSGKPYSPWDAALLGLAVGLSMPASLPNDARVLAFEFAALVLAGLALLVFARIRSRRPAVLSVVRRFFAYTAPVALALLIGPVYNAYSAGFFSSTDIHAITQVVVAVAKEYTPLGLAVRLLGRPELFHTPYLKFYTKVPITIVASYLWPVLALAAPIPAAFLLRLRDKAWITVAVLVALPCVLWGAGGDPPFGFIYDWITAHLPYGAALFPPFFPIQLVATKLYAVLVPFSIAVSYYGVRRLLVGRRRPAPAPGAAESARRVRWLRLRRSRLPGYAVAATLVGLVFLASVPLYTGGIFYGGSGSGIGYFVPQPYFEVESLLSQNHSTALLLPPLPTYVDTKWGYHGATAFYSAFYYPSTIIVPAFYGQYQTDFGASSQEYNLATHALEPPTGSDNYSSEPTQNRPWAVNTSNPAVTVYSYQPHPSFTLTSANSSRMLSWLNVTLPTDQPTVLAKMFQQSEVIANITTSAVNATGVTHSKSGIFDFLPGRYNSYVTAVGVSQVQVTFLVWGPSATWPTGGYETSGSISYLNLTFYRGNLANLITGPPSFSVGFGSDLRPDWVALMQQYHADYLLADYSVQDGLEGRPWMNDTLISLVALHAITPVYLTTELELWQFNLTALDES